MGSSPRMRGKPPSLILTGETSGLIPAHAGKTHQATLARLAFRAHPRACGENRAGIQIWHCERGSSPRMRGKLKEAEGLSVSPGLIPAHAGKTAMG